MKAETDPEKLVNNYARIEQQMNGVERVREYGKLVSEAPPTSPHDPPEGQWPSKGEIAFKDVQLRFRPELPLVLKGLTFHVRSGEKVCCTRLKADD
jgi:ATP-binding cassette subfamily C (CFTR/MRP) protein 1